ncbi:hypothetical protein VTN31DRAFT_1527 [Thermomyces dupontii]|uniref:uncharacterized protein n=1 Tax=Talaromyces thermophilus TaxID=28565 RepID=UPI0037424050
MRLSNTLLGLALLSASLVHSHKNHKDDHYNYVRYTAVPGYFLQDEPDTDPATFDYTAVNFGLINRTYDVDRDPFFAWKAKHMTQWERFYHQVKWLNKRSPVNVEYKVLFMGRHGEGWHNAAESLYGTPAWNCYWSELNGNGTANWNDVDLTPTGQEQARTAHRFWQKLIDEQRIHTPDRYYVSPLTRCLRTARLTFQGLRLPKHAARFQPVVLENLREGVSIHTCDHRSNKTYIKREFPEVRIEPGFTECDELWNGVTSETPDAQDARSLTVLDQLWNGDIFGKHWGHRRDDDDLFISITSHSGEIASLLRVLKHREFRLQTGGVLPVLVKAEKFWPPTKVTTEAWTVDPHCTEPPVTSHSVCVCPSAAAPVTTPLVPTDGC